MSETIHNTEVTELNCMQFASLMKEENIAYVLTTTMIGERNFLMIGGKTTRNILFEEIPGKLVTQGEFSTESLTKARLVTGYDDQDNPIGSTMMIGDKEIVEEEGKGLSDKTPEYSLKYMKAALGATVLPIDKDHLEFLKGEAGDTRVHITVGKEVTGNLVKGEDQTAELVSFGKGKILCEFDVPVANLRALGLNAADKAAIGIVDDKIAFFVIYHTEKGCGMFRVVENLKRLEPETPKDIIESIKTMFNDFDEIVKESNNVIKNEQNRVAAAQRDLKKDVSDALRNLAAVTNTSDVKRIASLEKANEELRAKNVELTAENKKFEKVKKLFAEE